MTRAFPAEPTTNSPPGRDLRRPPLGWPGISLGRVGTAHDSEGVSSVVSVAAGVHCLRTGWWRLAANVCFVESGPSWVLVDAVLGRRRRHAATLVEVPPEVRPPIIRAYWRRPGRRATAAAREARSYFGLDADPSPAQLRAVAERYPVFRIQEPAAGDRGGTRSPTQQSARRVTPGSRLATALLAASAAGAPLTFLAVRHLGRWGRVLVTTGCGVLLTRDASLVASGAPARLRPVPRALLLAEVTTSATAVGTAALRRRLPRRSPERTPAALLGAAAFGTLTIHTGRFAIYLRPGSGLRCPPPPTTTPPAAPAASVPPGTAQTGAGR